MVSASDIQVMKLERKMPVNDGLAATIDSRQRKWLQKIAAEISAAISGDWASAPAAAGTTRIAASFSGKLSILHSQGNDRQAAASASASAPPKNVKPASTAKKTRFITPKTWMIPSNVMPKAARTCT